MKPGPLARRILIAYIEQHADKETAVVGRLSRIEQHIPTLARLMLRLERKVDTFLNNAELVDRELTRFFRGVIVVHLSVGKVRRGPGGKNYYVKLAREDTRTKGDYYLKGGPTGEWFGRLADSMGLSGSVDAADFRSARRAFAGQANSLRRTPIIRNAGPRSTSPTAS